MHSKHFFSPLLSLAMLGLAFNLSSCTEKGCTDPLSLNFDVDAEQDDGSCRYPSLMLNYKLVVGDQAYQDGETYTINGVAVRLDAVNFYASDFVLNADGPIETDSLAVALIKPSQNTYSFAELPSVTINEVRFDIGVPTSLNGTSAHRGSPQ